MALHGKALTTYVRFWAFSRILWKDCTSIHAFRNRSWMAFRAYGYSNHPRTHHLPKSRRGKTRFLSKMVHRLQGNHLENFPATWGAMTSRYNVAILSEWPSWPTASRVALWPPPDVLQSQAPNSVGLMHEEIVEIRSRRPNYDILICSMSDIPDVDIAFQHFQITLPKWLNHP